MLRWLRKLLCLVGWHDLEPEFSAKAAIAGARSSDNLFETLFQLFVAACKTNKWKCKHCGTTKWIL